MRENKHECNDHQCNHVQVDSVTQSLDELNFERGIWGSILNSDFKKVEQLLYKNPSISNSMDSSGYFPLHYAVRNDKNNDIVQLLLDNGANINCQTSGGATPLHRSSYCNSINNTKLLLKKGITKVDLVDSDGMTPLHKAYQQGNIEIVNLLLDFGADPNILDKNKMKPLQLLNCTMNNLQTVLFWIDGVLDKEFEEKELYKDLKLNALNSIVNDGCVGQLLYSQIDTSTTNKDTLGEFNELLGFKYNEKVTEHSFKEKYMNLKIKLISNVEKELCIFSDSVKLDNQSELVDIISKTNEELILVHYQPAHNSLEDRRNGLLYIDSILSSLLKNEGGSLKKNYYINIVIGYNQTNIEIPLTAQQQQQSTNIPNWFNLPKQSYTLSNSQPYEPRLTSPLFTIHYNSIFTRKDNTKTFCESEFINGSNGKILLFQHFRELAFKLGKVPKYGA
ncbi:hypothetical protein RB653_008026 [Dictyostelium firmibasis]|uniref:Ankyrin repeat-containing protein n=1 Tax=Dictyostelium firmibasis TaxID=79012 RepID=A0AAN7YQT2_9MYCE